MIMIHTLQIATTLQMNQMTMIHTLRMKTMVSMAIMPTTTTIHLKLTMVLMLVKTIVTTTAILMNTVTEATIAIPTEEATKVLTLILFKEPCF